MSAIALQLTRCIRCRSSQRHEPVSEAVALQDCSPVFVRFGSFGSPGISANPGASEHRPRESPRQAFRTTLSRHLEKDILSADRA